MATIRGNKPAPGRLTGARIRAGTRPGLSARPGRTSLSACPGCPGLSAFGRARSITRVACPLARLSLGASNKAAPSSLLITQVAGGQHRPRQPNCPGGLIYIHTHPRQWLAVINTPATGFAHAIGGNHPNTGSFSLLQQLCISCRSPNQHRI